MGSPAGRLVNPETDGLRCAMTSCHENDPNHSKGPPSNCSSTDWHQCSAKHLFLIHGSLPNIQSQSIMTDSTAAAEHTTRIDITTIYSSADAWEDARNQATKHVQRIAAELDGPPTDPSTLRAVLERVETAYMTKQNLEVYVILANDIGRAEPPQREAYTAFETEFESAISSAVRTIAQIEDEVREAFTDQHPSYAYYLGQLQQRGEGTFAGRLENVVGQLETTVHPSAIIGGVWSDYKPADVPRPDGSTATIRPGEVFRTELAHPNRAYRRRVHDAFWNELHTYRHTLAAAMSQKLEVARIRANLRDFDSVRGWAISGHCEPETGVQPRVPGSVHRDLLSGIRQHLAPYHEMLDDRRKRLGLDDLRLWDLDVSTGNGDPSEVAFADAKDWIIASVAPLGDTYQDRTRAIFEEGQIDPAPRPDKSTVGYSRATADHGPFLVENYQDDLQSSFRLAHGVGHAVHETCFQDAPARYATSPRIISEIPAVLGEILLGRYLCEQHSELCGPAIDRLLRTLSASIYRSAMADAFWANMLDRQEDGAGLGPDVLDQLQLAVIREFRAPLTLDTEAGRTWMGRGTRPLFDSHAYVVGGVCALQIAKRLREGALARDAYLSFLRSTGSEPVDAALERLDCALTDDAIYEQMASEYRRLVAKRAQHPSA